MRRIEEFQSAELHERDVAARQFDLQRTRMMRSAEEHRLLFQCRAFLALLQHSFANIVGLLHFVAHRHQQRLLRGIALGPEILGEALLGLLDHGVGGSKDCLGGAVVLFKRDDVGR